MVTLAAPPASATSPGCGAVGNGTPPSNATGTGGSSLCSGVTPDFTTSSWNTPFAAVDTNTAPCYGLTNSYSTSESGGTLLLSESIEAEASISCTSNTANITINIGTHGATFTAWKSGSQYYTVVANFTVNDFLNPGTYCAFGGLPSARATLQASDAMYDDTQGTGVGYSSNGYDDADVIVTECNVGSPSQGSSISGQASFTTSSAIAYGDSLVPRASITATVWVSMPSTSGENAHSYSNVNFDNDGYGDITVDSIWVY